MLSDTGHSDLLYLIFALTVSVILTMLPEAQNEKWSSGMNVKRANEQSLLAAIYILFGLFLIGFGCLRTRLYGITVVRTLALLLGLTMFFSFPLVLTKKLIR